MKRVHLAWWKGSLGITKLSELKGSLARVEAGLRVLLEEGLARKTVSHRAETLTSFCDWCVRREYLAEDPLRHLTRLDTTPRERRRALTPDEIHRLLAVAPERRRLLYEVAFCTGLRANELRKLTIGHLEESAGGLRLDAEWTKNRKAGFQPLPRRLVVRLALSARGKALPGPLLYVPSHPARELYRDIDRAGIPRRIAGLGKVDFHACRVAYTTLVVESGASVKEAQELLRHSTPQLTMDACARARSERLGRAAGSVGQIVLGEGPIPARTEPPLPCSAEREKALTHLGAKALQNQELAEAKQHISNWLSMKSLGFFSIFSMTQNATCRLGRFVATRCDVPVPEL